MGFCEDDLHRALLRRRKPKVLFGSLGHDAAVLQRFAGHPVSCVDQCVEGVHWGERASARQVGRKAAARALSDLAATAAEPRALLCALAAPAGRETRWMRGVLDGVRAMGEEHGAELVGGDLSATPGPATISVTALGEYDLPGPPPGRDRAKPGQVVFLSGPCGGSSLGRHLRIQPRTDLGPWLAARGATALMDVSDGLAWDLYRLARASKVRIVLDMEFLRIHPDAEKLADRTGRAAWEHALHDGEDHELIACLPPSKLDRVVREGGVRIRSFPFGPIGRVERGAGLVLRFEGQEEWKDVAWKPEMGGWKHGEDGARPAGAAADRDD
jgi:thiamine-monophosphate kinase